MKKLLVLTLVLGMASLASAGLLISVDGVIDPPDTEINIVESQWVTIDIYSDGETLGDGLFLTIEGPAAYDLANATNVVNDPALGGILDLGNGMILIDLAKPQVPIPPIPQGTVVDLIALHCEGPGDVTLTLSSATLGTVFDTQVIHQVPEPATMALLGLGALVLRRKK